MAILTADRGHPVRGVFVANPSNDDQTVGRFPDSGARNALVLHQRTLAAKAGFSSGRSR